MQNVRLFRQTANGSLQFWEISSFSETIFIEYGLLGGETQVQTETINEGLAGRSIEDQILSRITSRLNKKLDAGYVYDEEIARANKPTNTLGLRKPMLATKLSNIKDAEWDKLAVQYKYDGHRCLIHNNGGEYIAYSRNGKLIPAITEIVKVVSECGLEDGLTLDGELYYHGVPLQTISSWARKRQPQTLKLTYVVYDVIADGSYRDRYDILSKLNVEISRYVIIAPTWGLKSYDSIPNILNEAIKNGFEGLILRRPDGDYQDGKRSKNLIKVKKFFDEEFLVSDIVESREGYGILVCVMSSGKTFRVTAPGDFDDKFKIMQDSKKYIGRQVNVKFANLTLEGIPFHPIATGFREPE